MSVNAKVVYVWLGYPDTNSLARIACEVRFNGRTAVGAGAVRFKSLGEKG